jgi:hypothetical protein
MHCTVDWLRTIRAWRLVSTSPTSPILSSLALPSTWSELDLHIKLHTLAARKLTLIQGSKPRNFHMYVCLNSRLLYTNPLAQFKTWWSSTFPMKSFGSQTYIMLRRLDMLPSLLTTDICSLVGHQDRFCFSVRCDIHTYSTTTHTLPPGPFRNEPRREGVFWNAPLLQDGDPLAGGLDVRQRL